MIKLYDLLEASNGQPFGELASHLFTGFCFDSRQAAESQIYVARRTDQGDTHQYMREAVDRGVTGILCTQPPDFDTQGISVVLVRDTEAALMNWSRFVLQKLGTQVVCVAGTVGKSLALRAISGVLSTRYTVHTSVGDWPGYLTVPATLAGLTSQHQFVVIELDIRKPGQMNEIVQIMQPDVVVINSLGDSYADAFNSLDELVAEHRLLLDRLSPTSLAVFNSEDEGARSLMTATRARVMTYGVDSFGADFIAYNVVLGLSNTGFDLRVGTERHVGRWIPWLGKHQLASALASLPVGLHYDIPVEEAVKVFSDFPYLAGRMNPLAGTHGSLLIDDTGSATPQSMLMALDWIKTVNDQRPAAQKSRIIFVMGDLDELGPRSSQAHRQIGQRAAEVADVIITDGADAALAGRAALDRGKDPREVVTTYSIQDVITALQHRFPLSRKDIVLFSGSPASRMELAVAAVLQDQQDLAQLARQSTSSDVAVLSRPARLNWVELDLDALATNVRGIKNLIGEQVALMAVVKADAYGHGAVSVARTALLNGAEYLAVSSFNEALELREAGIDAPILLLNYTPVSAVRQAIRQRLTLTLYDLDLARAYERVARELGETLAVHVKIDTGMGRLGLMPKEAMPFFRYLLNMKSLDTEGIYTHFADAGEDPDFTALQVRTFKEVFKPLRASGFNFAYIHAANSAGTLASKENHFNMVRVGLAMYGLSPSEQVRVPADFKPVLSWKTVVGQVKTLPPGHSVGYGRTYYTNREERIAIIPVGYADGFRRAPVNWGSVLVHGQRAPLVGRVSMEKAAIDVTDIPNVSIGDEVVLIGRQGDQVITADEIAARMETISYEILTTILPRAQRR